ncbi:MAG: CBS domain-containing protein, partial [Sphingomonas sp.]
MSETDTDIQDAPGVAESELDEDDRLKPEFVRAVLDAVQNGDDEAARALVEPLHPADIADLFELASHEERRDLARAVTDLLDGDVFAEMNDYVREDLIDALEPHQVADIAAELDTDDAVAIIEDMEEEDQRAVLRALDPDDRAAIEEALSYPEESAGRLMQRELIAVPEHWTVGHVLDYLRGNEDLTTDFWEIFVVDPAHKPIGTCELSWILRTPRGVSLSDVMKREQTLIPVEMDQEEVALKFQKYALISAAVVDGNGRLVGVITVD